MWAIQIQQSIKKTERKQMLWKDTKELLIHTYYTKIFNQVTTLVSGRELYTETVLKFDSLTHLCHPPPLNSTDVILGKCDDRYNLISMML